MSSRGSSGGGTKIPLSREKTKWIESNVPGAIIYKKGGHVTFRSLDVKNHALKAYDQRRRGGVKS